MNKICDTKYEECTELKKQVYGLEQGQQYDDLDEEDSKNDI